MTAKLYTRYQDLTKLSSSSNQFTHTPVLDDWQIKRDWNKVGSLTFKSPELLKEGTHVKLFSDYKPFGGQVVKKTESTGDFYSYDCLDYKRFLLTEFSLATSKKRASDVIKYLLKKYVSSVIKFKVATTKNIYSALTFKDTTVLDAINQLIYLEYKAGTLIYFYVDEEANLVFKPYPQTMKGYVVSDAYEYENSIDYSDIATGFSLINEKYKVLKQYDDKSLQAIWGDIDITSTLSNNKTGDSSSGNKNDAEIKKVVQSINKSLRGIKWARTCTSDTSKCNTICSGKTMECRGMSCVIFKKLKANKIPCKIVRYPSKAASSGYHDSVMVKYSTGWKDFDYTGMDRSFGANSSKSKSGTVRIEYKG